MGTGLEIAVYVGLGLTAIGGGISAYNSFQTAATQKNIANYNYAMQQRNAQLQQMSTTAQSRQMEQQARLQAAQARINASMVESEAQARNNNAQSLRNQAEAQAASDRENIRRSRMDAERMMATQRASAAKSGAVLETFSNRDIGTESARELELALNESHYQSDLNRRKTFGEAALEDFGAEMARAGGALNLSTGLAEASLTKSAAGLKEAEGRSTFLMSQKQAEIDRMSGYANAKGSQLAGWGTLFQTAGSVASGWANWNYMSSKNVVGSGYSISKRPAGL